jgi:hypothetical protein
MKNGISEIVGRAAYRNGGSGPLYRALKELLCSACGREIVEGALFTRHYPPGQRLRLSPRCSECTPFDLPERQRSALIDSLLASEAATPQVRGAAETTREEMRAKVERRLGPALSRTRRR